MNFKDVIMNIKPYKFESYSNISLTKLASVAVYFLYTKNIPLTFNYIGISMFKMFPDVFSCDEEFKEYPSLDRINREIIHMSITNSKKDSDRIKKPSILVGSAKLGFQITDFGIATAKQTLDDIKNPNINVEKKNLSSVDVHKQSTIKEYTIIKKSNEFNVFVSTGEIPKYSAWKIFGVKPFTQNSTIYQNIKLALIKAKELKDDKVVEFITKLLIQLN